MASGAVLRGRIIGKQVKILYDLVTVCGERTVMLETTATDPDQGWEGSGACLSCKSGDLPDAGTEDFCVLDHEELIDAVYPPFSGGGSLWSSWRMMAAFVPSYFFLM